MLKLGITGGIGSGKTTICKMFESLGVPIYYADDRAKKLMNSNHLLKQSIKSLLGSKAYHANGKLNRSYVSQVVFNNKEKLTKLNELVHPAVQIDGEYWFHQQKNKMAIKEAALLIESGSYKFLDKLIVVTAPVDSRIKRVMKRDHVTKEKVLARIKNQMTDEQRLKYADYIIDNSDNADVKSHVYKIYQELKKLAK